MRAARFRLCQVPFLGRGQDQGQDQDQALDLEPDPDPDPDLQNQQVLGGPWVASPAHLPLWKALDPLGLAVAKSHICQQ